MSKQSETLNIRITHDMKSGLDRYADALGRDTSGLVRELIELELSTRTIMKRDVAMIDVLGGVFRVFRTSDGSRVVGAAVYPYRCLPVIVFCDLKNSTAGCTRDQLIGIHLALDELVEYAWDHREVMAWDAPVYRAVTEAAGLDPDFRRPEFLAEHRMLGDELIAKVGTLFKHGQFGGLTHFIFDLVDLLRVDRSAEIEIYRRIRRDRIDYESHLTEGVVDVILVHAKSRSITSSTLIDTAVEFLPQQDNSGHTAIIHGFPSGCQPDGWDPVTYSHLRGTAVALDSDDPWDATVQRRLSDQGVKFIALEQVDSFLKVNANLITNATYDGAQSGRLWAQLGKLISGVAR